MPALILEREALLPAWTDEGWAAYTVPLGPRGLTWKPQPRRRPVADPVRAERASIDKALAELAEPEQIEGGWETVYFPVNGPMTWRPRRSSAVTAKDRYAYCEVASVPRSLRLASQAALNLAAAELGMRPIPRLHWFDVAGPKDRATFTSNQDLAGRIGAADFTVWVRIGMGVGEAIRTATHEARHFYQLIRGGPSAYDSRAIEVDADQYTRTFWARHGARLMRLAA